MPAGARIFSASALAISLFVGAITPVAAQTGSLDLGDDTGSFPSDGECDDLRFKGDGMAPVLLTDEIGRDATDCRSALAAGTISPNPLFVQPVNTAAIIFGDDTSEFARDGECDDVRFAHERSAATIYLAEDVGHDATDCKSGFEAGTLTWQGHRADIIRGITADEMIEVGGGMPHPLT